MPTKSTARRTTGATREELEQQQAEAQTALAIIYEAEQREQQEQAQRQAKAQEEFDRQLVRDYSRAQGEAQVREARATLEAALADDPLVRAFADYVTALKRVSHTEYEASAALARLGQPTFRPPPHVILNGVEEFVLRAVERISSDRVHAEVADLHARRDAAGTDTTKENR